MLGARNENSQRIYIALWPHHVLYTHIHILACTKRPGAAPAPTAAAAAPHSGINGLLLFQQHCVLLRRVIALFPKQAAGPKKSQQEAKILCQPPPSFQYQPRRQPYIALSYVGLDSMYVPGRCTAAAAAAAHRVAAPPAHGRAYSKRSNKP